MATSVEMRERQNASNKLATRTNKRVESVRGDEPNFVVVLSKFQTLDYCRIRAHTMNILVLNAETKSETTEKISKHKSGKNGCG